MERNTVALRAGSYQQFFQNLNEVVNRASSSPERERAVRLGLHDYDQLDAEDLFFVAEAAKALLACGGPADEVVRRLLPRLPETLDDSRSVSAAAGLLEIVHNHDPRAAERIVVERYLDCGQLMMQRRWLRRLRDAKDRDRR